MDLAGANKADLLASSRDAKIAVEKKFHKPFPAGDLVTFFLEITHVDTTFLAIKVEVFAGHDDVGGDFL